MIQLLLFACAPKATWQVQPAARVDVPLASVAVVNEDRACADVSDALIDALQARPGVRVEPTGATRLVVTDCSELVKTTVEVDLDSAMGGVTSRGQGQSIEKRRVIVDGSAELSVEVHHGAAAPSLLTGNAHRVLTTPWSDSGASMPARATAVPRQLDRDLAMDIADQVSPLSETLRRRLYRDPEPGTARALHNAAVEAERAGELAEALELAQEAWAADPSPRSAAYLEDLQQHAEQIGYALRAD